MLAALVQEPGATRHLTASDAPETQKNANCAFITETVKELKACFQVWYKTLVSFQWNWGDKKNGMALGTNNFVHFINLITIKVTEI